MCVASSSAVFLYLVLVMLPLIECAAVHYGRLKFIAIFLKKKSYFLIKCKFDVFLLRQC